MKSKKATKRALLSSALSLVLCFSMLLGTTFAWFTDSASTGVNIIQAGKLEIQLLGKATDGSYTADLEGQSLKFVKMQENQETVAADGVLWEPGATYYTQGFQIKNAGNLYLKFQMVVNGITNGDAKLLEAIDFYVTSDVTAAMDTWTELSKFASEEYKLAPGYSYAGEDYPEGAAEGSALYLVGHMKEEANNDYQGLSIEGVGITVYATQVEAEFDSFDNKYDVNATYEPWAGDVASAEELASITDDEAKTVTISTAAQLAAFAAHVNGTLENDGTTTFSVDSTYPAESYAGYTVKLADDIDLNNLFWTPIGTDSNPFRGNFDGQGYTVSNLNVSNSGWAGLIGHAGLSVGSDIKNVTINGATIRSNRMAGAVVGQLYGSIDNCHVKNATIMVTPNAVGDTYDNGDKVGGIVGWLGDNGNNRVLSNCSAENIELGAYRDVGGIAGYVASSTTVKGNSVKGAKITVDQITNYYGDKDFNAGEIYGRAGGTITEENNTSDEDTSIDITYAKNGLTLKKNGTSGEVTLYRVPADYEGTTVNVPEGVDTIGGYAFAYNSNIETIKLPSTVTTLNDRAFRDTSASTVILNEGLTNISYQAFRNALNVTSVEIPTTVTTISKEAFQNSGITTLTIPANVNTIEYGGCRDMKMLEEVVIEGNVEIPVYAFRACTNLKTVTLKGDNVTFAGRGMIFTNKENGDGSAITVMVANETVKDRLLDADTAAKDYGGYTILVGSAASTADELADALAAGENVALTADISCDAGIVIPEGGSLNGNGHTITYTGTDYDYHLVKLSTGAAIENVKLENYRVRTENETNGEVTLENVVISMDNDLTGLDISRGAGTAKLNNVECKSITDTAHLDPATQVQVDYTPYGDVLLGTTWGLEATDCSFGSLHGWNTTNGSNVSLTNTTCTVFRMHYWSNRTLYINGVETAWSESGAIPVAHDVGGCWSVQPAFK